MTIHEIPEEKEPTETKTIEKPKPRNEQLPLKNIVVGYHRLYDPEHASEEEVERNRRASKKKRGKTALFRCGGVGGHKLG